MFDRSTGAVVFPRACARGACSLAALSLAAACVFSLAGCAASSGSGSAQPKPADQDAAEVQAASYQVSVPGDIASLVQGAAAAGASDVLPADLAFLDAALDAAADSSDAGVSAGGASGGASSASGASGAFGSGSAGAFGSGSAGAVDSDGACSRANVLLDAAMSPAEAVQLVADLNVTVDDESRIVFVSARLPLNTPLPDACMAGEALAYLVSVNSQVLFDGQPVPEVGFASGPGVLWDAYTCMISLDDELGTLDLDGAKTPDTSTIIWQ